MGNRLGMYVEELLLLLFLFLDLGGIFGILPPDVEFFDKIIAWTLMALLLYSAKLTSVFFGKRDKKMEVLILVSMFFFVIKDLFLVMAEVSLHEPFFSAFYASMLSIAGLTQLWTFSIGGALFLLASFLVCRRITFTPHTLLAVLGEKRGRELTLKRYLKVLFVLCAFFVVVFNLIVEWLSLLGDDIITLLSIVLIISIIIKYRKKVRSHEIIFTLEEPVEDFYKNFLDHLKSKKGIALVVTGMLVLHLLTDVVVFIIPLLTGVAPPNFQTESISHDTIWYQLISQTENASVQDTILYAVLYACNILGILALMLIPVYVWYLLYKKKKQEVPLLFSVFLLFLFIPFFLTPTFAIAPIDASLVSVVGADLGTQTISTSMLPVFISWALLLCLGLIWGKVRSQRRFLFIVLLAMFLFMARYFLSYTQSLVAYYSSVLGILPISLTLFMGIFMVITLVFYLGGMILFILATEQEFEFL